MSYQTVALPLDKLPTRPLIEDRLTRLLTETSPSYFSLNWRRGTLFLLKFEPPAQRQKGVKVKDAAELVDALKKKGLI